MPTPTRRLAFTSCMNAELMPEQAVWSDIATLSPDALMLLGDQIYMDWGMGSMKKISRWRTRWEAVKNSGNTDRDALLNEFAVDMHHRYAAQWAVASFRALIQQVRALGDDRLYVVRDEHDFAWNNAVGAGLDSNPRKMPAEFVNCSNKLFEQFRSVLAGEGGAKVQAGGYPDMEDALPPAPQGADSFGPFQVLLLEQREHRTARNQNEAARRLLSEAGENRMIAAVQDGPRPVLIAGPSPLKHRYAMSNQGWWSDNPQEPSYPEYQQLIGAAKRGGRAVLYLGGDIHNVAWGGPVEPDSSVVQMLASGAAVPGWLWNKKREGFAWLDVASAGKGEFTVKLFSRMLPNATRAPVELALNASGNWTSPPSDGSCTTLAPDELSADELAGEPLSVVISRKRSQVDLPDGGVVAIDELPDYYSDETPSTEHQSFPDPVVFTPARSDAHLMLSRPVDFASEADVRSLVHAVFERALNNKRAAVLFIHGFQKPLPLALDQACSLRNRFDVEPLLYAWNSGEPKGAFKSGLTFGSAEVMAEAQHQHLSTALTVFNILAGQFQDVPAVVLARSLGTAALGSTVNAANGDEAKLYFTHVRRVVLSAPACRVTDAKKWIPRMETETLVTINAADRSLVFAGWVDKGWGDVLGRTVPRAKQRSSNAHYLDWSAAPAVERSHDYLLTQLPPAGQALNRAIVRGEAFAPLCAPAGVQHIRDE